jgi:ribosome-binding factor A
MTAAKSKSRFHFPEYGPGAKRRPQRVADAVKTEIAMLLLQKIKDPRLQQVTITAVEMTDDLRLARVYYSSVGSEPPENVAKGLEQAKGFIRKHLAGVLQMRYVPELLFKRDLSLAHQESMARLLKEIEDEDGTTSQ